jgi:hypothetical protein
VQALTQGASAATLLVTAALSAFVLIWTATCRPSLPLALLAAVLVSYHHLITDTTMMILPAGAALASALNRPASSAASTIGPLSALIFLAPPALLLADVPFYLLAVPMLALLLFWERHDRASLTGTQTKDSMSLRH